MENQLPPGAMDEITQLIFSGRKIEACKRYKEMRGASLLEAKQFIEKLTERLKVDSPDQFTKESGSGCAGMLLFLSVAVGSIWTITIKLI